MRLAALGIIGVCGLLLDASSIHARKWSSRDGDYSVEATYVEIQGGHVILERHDGRRISVDLERLSLSDLRYIEQRLDTDGSPKAIDPAALAEFEKLPLLPKVPENGLRYGREEFRGFGFTFTMTAEIGDFVERLEGRGDFRFHKHVDTLRGHRRLPPEQAGSGTGFVVHPDGFLITCAHVVEHAKTLNVHLGGRTYPGRVVSFVPRFDLALVQIPVKNLPALPLMAGDDAKPKDKVRAIGFPLATILGTGLKVTRGTVTDRVKGESSLDLLQIDAAVNPGNSGGPLVNDRGQVVGVVHAKRVGPDVSKVGFAVPVSDVRKLLERQGLALAAQELAEDLEGSELLARIAPSAALLTVTAQPPAEEDEEKVQVVTNFDWIGKLAPKEGGEAPPAPAASPGYRKTGTSYDSVTRYGKAYRTKGQPFPYLLLRQSALVIEPLSPSGAFTWQHEESVELALQPMDRPMSHFAARLPPLPALVLSPAGPSSPSRRLQVYPGRFPLPRPGGLPRPGRSLPYLGRTCLATARSAYEIKDVTSETITIKKTYRLEGSSEGDEPVLTLKGEGLITFNREYGIVQKSEFEGLLWFRHDGQDVSIPLHFDLVLGDPEEYARRQAEIQQRRLRQRAEQKAAEEAWEKLPPGVKVDRLLEKVRAWKSDKSAAAAAAAKLATLEPIEERRREVYEALSQLLDGSLVRAAIAPAVVWSSDEDIPDLIPLIGSQQRYVRRNAIDALCKIPDRRVAAAIAKRLESATDKSAARAALKRMGSVAEKPLLALLDHAGVAAKKEVCTILGSVGSEESVAALKHVAESDPDAAVRSRAENALQQLQRKRISPENSRKNRPMGTAGA